MKNQRNWVPRPQLNRIPAHLLVMLGLALAYTGCGIPATRQAFMGPAMPSDFRLNNGASGWGQAAKLDYYQAKNTTQNSRVDQVERPQPMSEIKQTSATSDGNVADRIRQAKLIEPAGELQRVESTSTEQDPTPPSGGGAIDEHSEPSAPAMSGNGGNTGSPQASGEVQNPTQDEAAASTSPLPVGAFFDDPHLLELFNLALTGNQELRILAEEINIANNEVYARSGEYRPFVTLGSGVGLEKSSRFSRAGAVEDQLDAAPGRGFPDPLPDFLTATNVTWELDIWRKLRNAQCAAAMRYLGTQDGRNYIVTRLIAEVAASYYELLALDNRLITLKQTIEIQEKSLKVAENMKAAGRGTELAVQRFQGEVRKNQSQILVIQQQIVEAENRINFLVGRYPQPVERSTADYIDLQMATLSAGLPADLLQNRADIRQAERNVTAAGLDLRVARARFFPSLGLRAGVGLNAFNTRYLLSTPESLIYNVALDLVGPLINKRAIQADYSSANAAQLQAIYNYQRIVLTAHIEVVNFLTKIENYRESINFKKQQLEALKASVDAADKLFQNARAEYIEVLLAQREMMEARMALIETKQQQLMAIVEAYQALGGGTSFASGQ